MSRPRKPVKPLVEAWVQAGKRLRIARKIKGLSVDELANISGYNANMIRKIENGVKNPTTIRSDSLKNLSSALDVSIDYICGDCTPTRKIHKRTREVEKAWSTTMRTPLAMARIEANMKSRELAAYLGISERYLRTIESGWAKIPRRLEKTISDFIAEHPPKIDDKKDMTAGEILAHRRRQALISQATLAKAVGVNRGNISLWERNIKEIPKEKQEEIDVFFESGRADDLGNRRKNLACTDAVYGIMNEQEISELKKRRKSLGVTQQNIASILHVSQSWIAACENGHAKMNRERQLEIKRYLDEIESQRKQK